MEKTVNRSELESARNTPDSSPEPNLIEKLKAFGTFEYVKKDSTPAPKVNDEDELDFRLFSAAGPAKSTEASPAVARINLRSPSPTSAEPAFVKPSRDDTYYFTGPPSQTEQQQFKDSAVSGSEVLARARIPWPGCACSWKVLHLPLARKHRAALDQSNPYFDEHLLRGDGRPATRTRLGKKARIRIRGKREATLQRLRAAKASAEDQAAAEREKRNRRNREKKMKRRARERAKKAGGVMVEEEDDSDPAD